ncbi:MAG: peptide deformylase [Candidatus Omnitrophica bacterium]|nr:peptide deformylase [Candidatus Omnitrophota bacterium]MBI3009598.1 peptide deformylase [Candidatus Omnitrophota bacterium]
MRDGDFISPPLNLKAHPISTLSIHRFPDPLLKRPTVTVERFDGALQRLVQAMVATMRRHPRCVGLAAPQVGSLLRVAVMDATGHPKVKSSRGLLVLVNAQILKAEGDLIQREGCLSVPDLTGNVRRFKRIFLRAYDEQRQMRQFELDGFESIIAQHEMDHLEGKLFLDRVENTAMDVFRRRNYAA